MTLRFVCALICEQKTHIFCHIFGYLRAATAEDHRLGDLGNRCGGRRPCRQRSSLSSQHVAIDDRFEELLEARRQLVLGINGRCARRRCIGHAGTTKHEIWLIWDWRGLICRSNTTALFFLFCLQASICIPKHTTNSKSANRAGDITPNSRSIGPPLV